MERSSTGYRQENLYDAFGGERVISGTCSQSYKFAGMEQDAETGLNHTLFRQQSSSLGRWVSPDTAGIAAASFENTCPFDVRPLVNS